MVSTPDQRLIWRAHHPHRGQLVRPVEGLPSHIKALKALGFLSHAFCAVKIQIPRVSPQTWKPNPSLTVGLAMPLIAPSTGGNLSLST